MRASGTVVATGCRVWAAGAAPRRADRRLLLGRAPRQRNHPHRVRVGDPRHRRLSLDAPPPPRAGPTPLPQAAPSTRRRCRPSRLTCSHRESWKREQRPRPGRKTDMKLNQPVSFRESGHAKLADACATSSGTSRAEPEEESMPTPAVTKAARLHRLAYLVESKIFSAANRTKPRARRPSPPADPRAQRRPKRVCASTTFSRRLPMSECESVITATRWPAATSVGRLRSRGGSSPPRDRSGLDRDETRRAVCGLTASCTRRPDECGRSDRR
jgi:hypothetical protein